MVLKPQDVMVILDLSLDRKSRSTYAERAERLGMSASEVHAAVRRLTGARLLDPGTKAVRKKPLLDFLAFGVPYVFAAIPSEVTRGMPTAWAAPVFAGRFIANDEMPPVWPHPQGSSRGVAVEPLYRSAAEAATKNPELYDLLALVDALRIGRARERSHAEEALKCKLNCHA